MPFDLPAESLLVLVFLLISFLNWVGEQVKKAKIRSREAGPQTRVREQEPPRFPTTQSTPPPAPEANRDPMREILESLGIPFVAEKEEPPPLFEQPVPAPVEVVAPPPIVKIGPSNLERDKEELNYFESAPLVLHKTARSKTNLAARKLLTAENAKTAFVLKEILDKPKCFDN